MMTEAKLDGAVFHTKDTEPLYVMLLDSEGTYLCFSLDREHANGGGHHYPDLSLRFFEEGSWVYKFNIKDAVIEAFPND